MLEHLHKPVVWDKYWQLCKPKVVLLIVFTAVVGMFLSTESWVPFNAWFWGSVGIGLAAAAGAALNHWVDEEIDARMQRTQTRPLPAGELSGNQALIFALTLAALSMLILIGLVNLLTAALTLASMIGYAVIYSMFLKHSTPQNIVLGGAAGATPPVLGWCAVTGELHSEALLLFLIIFVWTPPHFWALAIKRVDDYANAGVPMLPVTHGIAFTKLHILLYTLLLVVVTLFPFLVFYERQTVPGRRIGAGHRLRLSCRQAVSLRRRCVCDEDVWLLDLLPECPVRLFIAGSLCQNYYPGIFSRLMAHPPPHKPPSGAKKSTVSPLSIVKSVLAGFIGIQTEANRKRDFESGKFWHFVVAGLVFVGVFMLLIWAAVQYLIASA